MTECKGLGMHASDTPERSTATGAEQAIEPPRTSSTRTKHRAIVFRARPTRASHQFTSDWSVAIVMSANLAFSFRPIANRENSRSLDRAAAGISTLRDRIADSTSCAVGVAMRLRGRPYAHAKRRSPRSAPPTHGMSQPGLIYRRQCPKYMSPSCRREAHKMIGNA